MSRTIAEENAGWREIAGVARANENVLKELHALILQLRDIPGLTETKPGIFYIKRLPMLHFHQTESGIVADLKCLVPQARGFDRFLLEGEDARRALIVEATRRCAQLRKPTRKAAT